MRPGPAERAPSPDLARRRKVHLVGIGGAGMSGIARMLLQRGHVVSGTDRQASRTLEALRAMGAQVRVGHDRGAGADAELVVTSTAVPSDNVELVAARSRGIPVLHRSEMLAALMAGYRAILVAGTHGKTTTTSMVVVGLQSAGADPSFAIGGALNEAGSNAHAGTGDVFVAEADESDRSFLAYEPDLAVVTNIELDHVDNFADLGELEDAFDGFLRRRRPGAVALLCADDPAAVRAAARATGEVVTYGGAPAATFRLDLRADRALLRREREEVAELRLAVPGAHNLLNAAGAVAACALAGADPVAAARGLVTFAGVQRRFQRLGTVAGVEVVDDYAHHPTELAVNIATARTVTAGRVIVVVQPHLYSRTRALGAALGRAAAGADVAVITDVYGAREDPVPGVTGAIVADAARAEGATVIWQPHLAAVPEDVLALVQPGDLVLVTGAGDVNQVGPAILEGLRVRRG